MRKEIVTKLRKVGAKDNPSFVIPVDKKIIKDEKINTNKKIKAVITQ